MTEHPRAFEPSSDERGLSIAEVAARLDERPGELARHLLGEPNRGLSTRKQLRFGRKGSIAVEIQGPDRGRWYDHEDDIGGDGLALICHKLGLANGTACEWAIEWLGLERRAADQIRRVEPTSAQAEIAPKDAGCLAEVLGDA